MTLITFARQSAADPAHTEYSGERLLNWYARSFPDGGIGQALIVPSPGMRQWAVLDGINPVQAVHTLRGTIYAACGGKLWSVRNGVVDQLGSIQDDTNTTIVSNGLQVAVAAGGRYSVWNGAALSNPLTGAFGNIANVAAVDNYVLLFEENGERFSVSQLADATLIDPLDFASAEGTADFIVRGHIDHAELWIFGTESTEIFGNSGDADFPFARLSGGRLDRGCAFPSSVASEDNSVFWVGNDRVVYRANGYQPIRISTEYIEALIQDIPEGADVRGFSFTQDGAKVYCLRMPDAPALMYNIATGLWSERNSGLDDGPWLATCATTLGELTVLGGQDGRLYTPGGLTDGGRVIVREAVSLPLTQAGQRITLAAVEVTFKTGATDIGREANVMLSISRDGRTWGEEKVRPLGQLGQYLRRARWHALGQARQFRVRVRVTDPIDTAIYGAAYRAIR